MEIEAAEPAEPARVSRMGRFLAIAGSLFLFAPLVGFFLTAFLMILDFSSLAESGRASDPSYFSRHVGAVLVTTAIGLGLGLLGSVLVCIAIFGCRYAPAWLRRTLLAASALWLLFFPAGTVMGILAIVLLLSNRRLFDPREG